MEFACLASDTHDLSFTWAQVLWSQGRIGCPSDTHDPWSLPNVPVWKRKNFHVSKALPTTPLLTRQDEAGACPGTKNWRLGPQRNPFRTET
jgi:hypothetical protein